MQKAQGKKAEGMPFCHAALLSYTSAVLQKLRESLALVLLALLPFHALLITVATKVILGPDHAPLGALALWKEGLLVVIVALAFVEIFRNKPQTPNLKSPFDLLDVAIGLFAIVALAISLTASLPLSATLYGFRYDLLAPLAFLVLRRVPWSGEFRQTAAKVLVVAGAIVTILGLGIYVLPDAVYRALGYSDLHSLYVPEAPLAAFQQLGGSALRRMQGTLSGPNQFGLWLLLPWSIVLTTFLRKLTSAQDRKVEKYALSVLTLGIVLSFSRSAWVAATVIGALALWIYVPKSLRRTVAWIVAVFLAIFAAILFTLFPQAVLRSVSNRGHIEKPLAAVAHIAKNPIGSGLGAAGPASNRVNDACVELPAGSDAAWAKDRPELCVFVGGTQVQPLDSVQDKPVPCRCPFLPENWYLQIGVEAGIVGMLLWIAVTGLMVWKLQNVASDGLRVAGSIAPAVFFAFLGVSIAGLFLHSWEDASVAMSLWLLAAAVP